MWRRRGDKVKPESGKVVGTENGAEKVDRVNRERNKKEIFY